LSAGLLLRGLIAQVCLAASRLDRGVDRGEHLWSRAICWRGPVLLADVEVVADLGQDVGERCPGQEGLSIDVVGQ
jgi:hypothetical protein